MRRRALLSQSGKKLFGIDIDKYMTMEALSGGLKAKLTVSACQYCVDGDGDWKDLPADTFTEFVEEGHFLSFKASGLTPDTTNGIGTFVTADDVVYQFNLRGNCMAMLYGDDAENYVSIPNYGFYKLFKSNTGLQSVSEKFIGATGVGNSGCRMMFNACTSLVNSPVLPSRLNGAYCFYQMYYGCTSLTDAPELPATSLQVYCYAYMFYNCSSLQNAPVLPATTLKNYCYYYMFRGCSNITSITLPAPTLVTGCYNRMLYNCSKLNYIKASFTVIPDGSNALTQWVYGVAKTGTFVKAADATWDVTGTSGVPQGWTVKDYELPEGYTEVEYVDSTSDYGKIYLPYKTLYYPTNFKLELDIQCTRKWAGYRNFLYSTHSKFSNNYYGAVGIDSSNNVNFYYGSDNNMIFTEKATFTNVLWNDRLLITQQGASCTINGETGYVEPATAPSGNLQYIYLLYDAYNDIGMRGKVYSAKIYVDDVLICDWIPCISSDGTYGMYDKKNKKITTLQKV